MFGTVSVCLSRLQQHAAVCCCGPGGQAISIDSGGHPPSSNGAEQDGINMWSA